MANPEHLAKLKEGVEAWNRWRVENLDITPDLNKADLHGANLDGANLQMANLVVANLVGAKLVVANLVRADLEGADLRGAKLVGADLRGAKLVGADLRKAKLEGANLRDADLREAEVRGADLRRAMLRGADLHGAKLEGTYEKLDGTYKVGVEVEFRPGEQWFPMLKEELKVANITRIILQTNIPEYIDTDEASEALANFIKALNAYHIACGGKGIKIDEWDCLARSHDCVEV